jgi:hypothetical protein
MTIECSLKLYAARYYLASKHKSQIRIFAIQTANTCMGRVLFLISGTRTSAIYTINSEFLFVFKTCTCYAIARGL